MSEMDNAVRMQIIAEIAALTRDDPVADDEFTITHFVKQTGMLRRTAAAKLESLIERGELTKRLATVDGTKSNVYKRVTE